VVFFFIRPRPFLLLAAAALVENVRRFTILPVPSSLRSPLPVASNGR